jgi:hypothetical protein
VQTLQAVFPDNKVGIVNRVGCVDISAYSNKLPGLLGWKWDAGPKHMQGVRIPTWVWGNVNYLRICLRGLFQTDGCAYCDRGYVMANFTNVCKSLAQATILGITSLGYKPNLQIFRSSNTRKMKCRKYVIRISRQAEDFLREIGYWKA